MPFSNSTRGAGDESRSTNFQMERGTQVLNSENPPVTYRLFFLSNH